jgi:hypothetical protein
MKFDDFSLDPDQMLTASVRMFIDCGLIEEFNIDYQVHSGMRSNMSFLYQGFLETLTLCFLKDSFYKNRKAYTQEIQYSLSFANCKKDII